MKESDIRPAELFDKYLELCSKDSIKYFDKSIKKQIACPACNSNERKKAFNKNGFDYVVCNKCLTLYQSPRPRKEEFEKFYKFSDSSKYWANTFFPSVAEVRRKYLFGPKVNEIIKLCRDSHFKPDIIADIGAGFGIFLEEWRKRNNDAKLVAIEPNPVMAKICREKKLSVTECFAEDAEELYDQIDLVIAFEVIEHVHNPFSFCKSLRKLLVPGGKILLTGLAVDGFDIQVLWDNSKSISPPHHINLISIEGYKQLMRRSGFSIIKIFTPGKLDVDIVSNGMNENPEIQDEQRFVKILLSKNDQTKKDFQKFLSEHQLSSHCWIWAQR